MTFTSTPAVRIVVSPVYGPMSIHPSIDGFDAVPMDPTLAARSGLLALSAPDMDSIIHHVHEWK